MFVPALQGLAEQILREQVMKIRATNPERTITIQNDRKLHGA